jgi:hypothetical protein
MKNAITAFGKTVRPMILSGEKLDELVLQWTEEILMDSNGIVTVSNPLSEFIKCLLGMSTIVKWTKHVTRDIDTLHDVAESIIASGADVRAFYSKEKMYHPAYSLLRMAAVFNFSADDILSEQIVRTIEQQKKLLSVGVIEDLGVLDVDAVTHSGKMLGLAIASLSSVNKRSSFVRGNGVYDYERIVSSIENFEKRYPDSDKQLADVRLTLDTFIDDNEDIAINVFNYLNTIMGLPTGTVQLLLGELFGGTTLKGLNTPVELLVITSNLRKKVNFVNDQIIIGEYDYKFKDNIAFDAVVAN